MFIAKAIEFFTAAFGAVAFVLLGIKLFVDNDSRLYRDAYWLIVDSISVQGVITFIVICVAMLFLIRFVAFQMSR